MLRKRQMLLTLLVVTVSLVFAWVPVMAKTQISMWLSDAYGQNMNTYFEGVVRRFEQAHPEIGVELTIIPNGWSNIRDKFVTAAAGNMAPTIVWSGVDTNLELE